MEERPSHMRRMKAGAVKNKAPASIQVTAEQLLREAWEHKESGPSAKPIQRIADLEELEEFQRTERQQYEMRIVRNRGHIPLWIRYARWEEAQEEFARARSIWERAIDNDYRAPAIWLGYAEMEMRHRFINHARNVFDRAVALLPRVDQLWMKYIHMEEMLGKVELARLIYSRWLKWFPDAAAYFAAVRFEIRHGETGNARGIYERVVAERGGARNWVKFAKFEERLGELARARSVFERAADAAEDVDGRFFVAFAKFEERRGETERARGIYKFAMGLSDSEEVRREFARFEKQEGGAVEEIILEKRRGKFEEALRADGHDYDTWIDLLQLEEEQGDKGRIREVYERAVEKVPPVDTKRGWGKYIYLWIGYASWEELECENMKGAANVYKRCIGVMSGRKFSFGKVWILAGKLEIRRGEISACRKLLGRGLGIMPGKHSLYKAYIEIEIVLCETDRARRLYGVWLERNATVGEIYVRFAGMEKELMEYERARRILEIGIGVDDLQGVDEVWKTYIDLEVWCGESEKVVQVFERYLKTGVGVSGWKMYAEYMDGVSDSGTRDVYRRGHEVLKERMVTTRDEKVGGVRRDRAELLEEWLEWEKRRGGEVESVEALRASRVKRKRVVEGQGWEEYVEFVFAEEVLQKPQLKILEAARKWKMEQ